MTLTQENALRERAEENGIDFDSVDTIDIDACGCTACFDIALAEIEALVV